MGFWLFCLAMDLLVPAVMIYFGRRFAARPPARINALFGYRSSRSMKNQQTWDFAHRYCGKLWFRAGLVLAVLSPLPLLAVTGRDVDTVGTVCGGVSLIQAVLLVATIFPVERALKREFDEFGQKRLS